MSIKNRGILRMRGRDKALIAMALTMVMMLSGCSSSQTDNLLDSGIKYIQDHEYQKAKETLEKALSQGASEHDCCRALGICSLEQGDYDSAIEYFKTALSSGNGWEILFHWPWPLRPCAQGGLPPSQGKSKEAPNGCSIMFLRESLPRQVSKKFKGPQGERGLEFSRRKKGQTVFPSTFLRII